MPQIFWQNFPQDCMELKWQDARNIPVYVGSVADPETARGAINMIYLDQLLGGGRK